LGACAVGLEVKTTKCSVPANQSFTSLQLPIFNRVTPQANSVAHKVHIRLLQDYTGYD